MSLKQNDIVRDSRVEAFMQEVSDKFPISEFFTIEERADELRTWEAYINEIDVMDNDELAHAHVTLSQVQGAPTAESVKQRWEDAVNNNI